MGQRHVTEGLDTFHHDFGIRTRNCVARSRHNIVSHPPCRGCNHDCIRTSSAAADLADRLGALASARVAVGELAFRFPAMA